MSTQAFGTVDAHDFMGKNGFVWWVGVVVNNDDPLNLGRAQVRIFGFHNEGTEPGEQLANREYTPSAGIPNEDLPWALALAPLGNAQCPKSPPINEWVLGFFLDGLLAQQPVMLGVLPGYRWRTPAYGDKTNQAHKQLPS